MMSFQQLWHRLVPLYDAGEAQALVRTVLEVRFGFSPADIYTGKVSELSTDEATELEKIMQRLVQAEPVQYILGEAVFLGRSFRVAPGVLIPRPETEDLCRWIVADYGAPYCALLPPAPLQVLDVGTGSGCIAVSLALALRNSMLTAWDVSGDALLIARDNAMRWGAEVDFRLTDALNPSAPSRKYDVIVSNPPYVCRQEAGGMARNVLEYEPDTALFVPDDDPLLFYRAIAGYGVRALSAGGAVYFETNPLYIYKVKEMLSDLGYRNVGSRKDRFGKERFVKGERGS